MAKKINVGAVVEFLDMVGQVVAVDGSRLIAETVEGDTFEAPARVCTVKFAALPDAGAIEAGPWYTAPADDAETVARNIWGDDEILAKLSELEAA